MNNRAYFKIMWPANYALELIFLRFNENLIGGTSTDDTIIHVADGTTKITESGATSIVEGVAPGINGEVYAADDSDRTIEKQLQSIVSINMAFSALFSTEDRTFSGLIYNSAHGTQNFASPASITNKSTFIGNIVFHGTKFII